MILAALLLVVAQDPSVAAAAPQSGAPAGPVSDDGRMVCKRIARTGSRMAPKRVCLTAFEWRQTAKRAQNEVGEMKRQSRMERQPMF